ncbi:hypothetical protein DLJ48_00755 [Oenococcus sicerae]|uniref:Uncharacterized protein n=1 Tax=Oenococcus sicerae TaxID=2203724 RepID=A0AAJ1VPJ6_9LACO|nr:hypothetical protein [Oenococcus sicerae]MDN6900879.1 hypothetical protein [Oenococcus sicerae]QAS69157.1 hypothetical protein DLJ48_00755 [Oenococcus sicerae]
MPLIFLFIVLLILAAAFGFISFGVTAALVPILIVIFVIGLLFSLIHLIWHGIGLIILFIIALAIYDWLKKR